MRRTKHGRRLGGMRRERLRQEFYRQPRLEPLENRMVLSTATTLDPADVNADGRVAPLDALLIVNAFNARGGAFLSDSRLDVTGNRVVNAEDVDAVLASLDREFQSRNGDDSDAGDGSAVGGDDGLTNFLFGEGEGSGSGGGGGSSGQGCVGSTELPVVRVSSGSTADIPEEAHAGEVITLQRTGGDINCALTVALHYEGYGSHPAGAGDYDGPITVQFAAESPTVTFNVTANDDTEVEQNEKFRVIVIETPGLYTVHASDYRVNFTIADNEWRWVTPQTPDTDFEWSPPPTAIVIPNDVDGALYPIGAATVEEDGVVMSMKARAEYWNTYWATAAENEPLQFDCNSQSGDITERPVPPPASTGYDNKDWVNAAMSYMYTVHDEGGAVGGTLHTVDVSLFFHAGAGGEYEYTAGYYQNGEEGYARLHNWNPAYTWAVNVSSSHSATLRCHRGPE